MADTKIPWATTSWNPVSGCTKISPGCQNCYAERMAKRLQGMGAKGYENGFGVTLHPERLQEPRKWKRPRRIFVCSMGDLFHKDVPWNFIYKVFEMMLHSPQHTFMVLTKRAERLNEVNDIWLHLLRNYEGTRFPLFNVWLGVTCESNDQHDRIWKLLKTPAALRYVSYEPALGPLDLNEYECLIDKHRFKHTIGRYLDWVIAGCESGPHRRPAKTDWFSSLRDQCIATGTLFFLKQMEVNGKIVEMPELDGRVWSQLPKVLEAAKKPGK